MYNDSFIEQSFKARPMISFYLKMFISIVLILTGGVFLFFIDLLIGFVLTVAGICLLCFYFGERKVEYEYTLTNGSIEVAAIFNATKRKELCCIDLSKATLIIPSSSQRAQTQDASKKYRYVSGKKDANTILIYADDNKKACYELEPDEKSFAHIKNYARNKMSDF